MQLPPPPAGAPGMFRCAESGLIASMFKKAGMKNVSESEVSSSLNASDTDTYWNMMTEVAAPFVAALSKADEAMKAKIKKEVFENVAQRFQDGKVNIQASALLISGSK